MLLLVTSLNHLSMQVYCRNEIIRSTRASQSFSCRRAAMYLQLYLSCFIHTSTLLNSFYMFLTTYDYNSRSLFIYFLRYLNCVKELNCCGGEPNSSWTALPQVLAVLVMMLFPLHPLSPLIPARMLAPLSSRLSRRLRQSRAAYLHVQELLLCHLNPKNSS